MSHKAKNASLDVRALVMVIAVFMIGMAAVAMFKISAPVLLIAGPGIALQKLSRQR